MNRFFNLPIELQTKIYAADSTYKDVFTDSLALLPVTVHARDCKIVRRMVNAELYYYLQYYTAVIQFAFNEGWLDSHEYFMFDTASVAYKTDVISAALLSCRDFPNVFDTPDPHPDDYVFQALTNVLNM